MQISQKKKTSWQLFLEHVYFLNGMEQKYLKLRLPCYEVKTVGNVGHLFQQYFESKLLLRILVNSIKFVLDII